MYLDRTIAASDTHGATGTRFEKAILCTDTGG